MTCKRPRSGLAAVEFALCAPLILMLLFGIWEVGRIVEVQQVMWNASREAARQASTGEDDLAKITAAMLVYIQRAEPTTMDTTGLAVTYVTSATPGTATVTAMAGGKELYSVSFSNKTDMNRGDPKLSNQLDKFDLTVSMPFNNVKWAFVNQITDTQTLTATSTWYSMRDTPIVINATLPVQ